MDRANRQLPGISRRTLLQAGAAGGIGLTLTRLAAAEEPSFLARETLPGPQQWNPSATAAGRIDSVAKVTGAKLYASDFRAADLPGWPSKTSHALLIRAADATHVYTGLDLSQLAGRACQTKSGSSAPGICLARQDGIPSEDQAMTVRHSASAAERLCL